MKDGNILTVELRYDDECGNGHNTFAITGEMTTARGRWLAGGCLHKDIAKVFPEYAHLIPYHLCSSDSPMYYVANTMYHAKEIPVKQDKWYFYLENKLIKIVDKTEKEEMILKYGDNAKFKDYPNSMAKKSNLEAARDSAIWPEATLQDLQSKEKLIERLPVLMETFKNKMIELGFIW